MEKNIKVEVLSGDKTKKCELEINFELGAVNSVFSNVKAEPTDKEGGKS